MAQPADLSALRLLMAQHHLGTGDLPETGSKSMGLAGVTLKIKRLT